MYEGYEHVRGSPRTVLLLVGEIRIKYGFVHFVPTCSVRGVRIDEQPVKIQSSFAE